MWIDWAHPCKGNGQHCKVGFVFEHSGKYGKWGVETDLETIGKGIIHTRTQWQWAGLDLSFPRRLQWKSQQGKKENKEVQRWYESLGSTNDLGQHWENPSSHIVLVKDQNAKQNGKTERSFYATIDGQKTFQRRRPEYKWTTDRTQVQNDLG